MKTTKYLTEFTVKDSQGNETTLEVHEVLGTGKVFAIDWSYADEVTDIVFDPYDGTKIRTGNPP